MTQPQRPETQSDTSLPSPTDRFVRPGVLELEPYVPGTPVEQAARELGLPAMDFVKLASNENPLGMSPRAAQAVRERLARAYQYPEVDCPDLRRAVARELEVEARSVVVGNGADGVLYAFFLTLLEPGVEVVIPDITFSLYSIVTRALGATVITTPLEDLRIDTEDMLGRITDRTRVVCLCNPNNPTGDLLDARTIRAFLDRVPAGVMVALDEVYCDFADPALFHSGLEELRRGRDNVFVFRSCSKIYGLAGLRVGWGVGAPDLVERIHRVRPPFDVSVVAAIAAEAALGDTAFRDKTLDLTRRGKETLYRGFRRLGLPYVPSHANFVLVDTGRDGRAVYDALLRQGVIIRAGLGGLPRHIRVTVGTPEQNERLLAALERALGEGA